MTAWTDVGASSDDGDDCDNNGLRRMEKDSSVRSLLRDLTGLFSAMGYGAYTVLLRHLCPKDKDRMSMQLLFSNVGLLNMISLFPVAIWLVVSSQSSEDGISPSLGLSPEDGAVDGIAMTTTTTLTWTIFLFLILKVLLGNVISDYLWARAVILTSATVASVGLGLTIRRFNHGEYQREEAPRGCVGRHVRVIRFRIREYQRGGEGDRRGGRCL